MTHRDGARREKKQGKDPLLTRKGADSIMCLNVIAESIYPKKEGRACPIWL